MAAIVCAFLTVPQPALAEEDIRDVPLRDAPILLAQNQPRQSQGGQVAVVVNRFENRTGATIDLLRVENGGYRLLAQIPPNTAYNYSTRYAETLAFGYNGQAILATHRIVGNIGETIPIPLGPDLLARAGIQPPQQGPVAQPQLPPGGQTQLPPGGQQQARPSQGEQQPGQQRQAQLPGRLPAGGKLPGSDDEVPEPPKGAFAAPTPQPTAPPPVTDAEVIPKQNPELAAVPERRAFRNQPWSESPHSTYMMWSPGSTDALAINQHGEFEYVGINQNQSAGTWFFEQPEGAEHIVIRNVQEPDKALFVPQGAGDGTQVRFGPEGIDSPSGRWKKEAHLIDYSIFRSVSNPNLTLSHRNGRLTVTSQDATDPNSKAVWMAYSVGDMKELMGIITENIDSFAEMADNFSALEREQAEKKRRELEEEEKQRLALQRKPWLSGGGQGQHHMTMRLGVDTVEEPVPGKVHSLRYYFDVAPYPYMRRGIYRTHTVDEQQVELRIRPEVFAWAENNLLYVRVKTSEGTSMSMLKNGRGPSIDDTLNTYYIGNASVGLWATGGSAEQISPSNENTVTDAGTSSDSTSGIDISTESLGGNYSESRGTNTNFQVYDYRISGKKDRQGALYTYEGCGLSVTIQQDDNCTYSGPQDLWLPSTNTVRNLKAISLNMPLLITDTIFIIDPKSVYWADEDHRQYGMVTVMMNVGFNLHALDVVQVRQAEQSKAKSGWEEFKGGFEFVYRPDKWDFSKSLADQDIVRKHTMKAKTFARPGRFDINLRLDVSQLKPFLNIN
ncbi:hypothetical protein [Stappia sp. ES.058]|uniref:proline-rich domain-containing protein n=1 Tax=Stappia sp. ES.058 TaxID=1881061 RepID=UPI000B871E1C|nr:hypothetical protein [Stappia sp. ES.058]